MKRFMQLWPLWLFLAVVVYGANGPWVVSCQDNEHCRVENSMSSMAVVYVETGSREFANWLATDLNIAYERRPWVLDLSTEPAKSQIDLTACCEARGCENCQ